MTKIKIIVGKTTFHSPLADGNPEWRVIEDIGNDAFKARTTEEGESYHQNLFTGAEIRERVASEKHDSEDNRNRAAWLKTLQPGTILHFDSGFGQFVRYEVVGNKNKRLKAIALVGDWDSHDLPQRQADGSIYSPYHAEEVVTGTPRGFPHWSRIVESPCYHGGVDDPTKMTPLDLRVPDLTPEEEKAVALNQLLGRIEELFMKRDLTDQQRLECIHGLVTTNSAKAFMRIAMRV